MEPRQVARLLAAIQAQCECPFTQQHKQYLQRRGPQGGAAHALSQKQACVPPTIAQYGAFKETKAHAQQRTLLAALHQASSIASNFPHAHLSFR